MLTRIKELIAQRKVKPSRHGYVELRKDDLFYDTILETMETAIVVEEYPDFAKGPCVLVRQSIDIATPVHVLWGIAAGTNEPAVLITAYRPDPSKWDAEFLRRKP